MKTITTRDEWLSALRDSRSKTLVVQQGNFRFVLADGKVVSQSGQKGMEDLEVECTIARTSGLPPYIRYGFGVSEMSDEWAARKRGADYGFFSVPTEHD